MSDIVYLDNNATTAVASEVREAMMPYLTELYGNPSSIHTFGGQVANRIAEAREAMAALLGAQPSELLWTSCGSESDSAAILSALECMGDRRHIVTSRVEHPAVRVLCRYLQDKKGCRLTEVSVDAEARLDMDEYARAVSDDTALVTLMWSNNETGVTFPVDKCAAIAKAAGAMFHTDAVQAVGKIPINLARSTDIDMLSLSGHKLHAPKGIGALYVRRGTPFVPFLRGGHQESNRRAGTEAVPNIVALGRAAELAADRLDDENTRVKALRDRLEAGLLKSCPDARVNGDPTHRLPNTTNISFEYIEGEAILLLLDQEGICASSGSACTTGSLEPSHVLRAMGVPFTAAHGSIRFSLSYYTTDADVDRVLEVLPGIVRRLREISPFGRDKITAAI
jgi:cysteine desulfurase